MKKYLYKIGFIGMGNMAKAIAKGVLSSNFIDKKDIVYSDLNATTELGDVKYVDDNKYVLDNCEYVVIAIKPQVFKAIKDDFAQANCKTIISIMAGVSVDYIKNIVHNSEVFRIMPNIPCMQGKGMSVIANNSNNNESNVFVEKMFTLIGKAIFMDESYFDAVTSISGSGSAYVYYFIKALIDGGVDGGLTLENSKLLAMQTVAGALAMLENSSESIETLIQNVCSKGGTTIEAINAFDKHNLNAIVREGVKACRDKSELLSKN